MMEFSVNNRERKDTPCGYPKSFRLVSLNHTVKDVFYTDDVYDKFIAIGKGISYSDDFVNGYWHKAIFNATADTEFVSGCHLSSADIDVNIIICDNGEYQYSFDGTTWYDGGRICSGLYTSGWACICANGERVVAVNSKHQRAGENESMAMGVGACGTWDPEKEAMVWEEISLPFPSSSIKYFNGYFYIYGQVESTSATVEVEKPNNGVVGDLTKTYFTKVAEGTTEIIFTENGGFSNGAKFDTYVVRNGRETLVESTSKVEGNTVTITLSAAAQEVTEYAIRYKVPSTTYDLTFISSLGEDVQNVTVHAKTNDGGSFEVKDCIVSKTDNENEYSVVAECEDYENIISFNIIYYSLSSNIADLEQSAISDNGINFCTNEDSFSSDTGSFICDAAYGRGIYMAVTTEGNAIYSTQTPSRNWDYVKSLNGKGCNWSSITFVCGMFVVCGTNSDGDYVMYCSYNTYDWIQLDFTATGAIDLADVTAYPVKLINCRGTLIATAMTPQNVADGVIELSDEKGFYACDTYISIEEEMPSKPEIREEDDAYQRLITRLTAAENHIRRLENELASRPVYNQYKGDITSQEQFDEITAGNDNIIGDTYNLTCPVSYIVDSMLYQSDFSSFLFNDDGLEVWNDYKLVRDDYNRYLWILTWNPETLINSSKVHSVLSTAVSCACTVYNNSTVVMSGAIESVNLNEGNLKIRTLEIYPDLQSSVVWTSISVDNKVETELPAGTNIIWNGAGWDDTSKNDSMSNYITVSQAMKMLVYGTSDIYDELNSREEKSEELDDRVSDAEEDIRVLEETTASLVVNTPEIYTKESITAMNAITGMKHGDMCIIISGTSSAQSIYRYYTKDISGNNLTNPQWVWLTDLSLFAPLPVLELTDGNWNYSLGNSAKITLAENTVLSISNVYSGAYGVIDVYGNFTLTLPSNSYSFPPDWDYLVPNANQHYRYSFYYDGNKFDWSRSVRENV